MRALEIACCESSKHAHEVPTIAEVGLPFVERDFWFGPMAPAGAPQPIIRNLHEEITRGLRNPDVRGLLNKMELAPRFLRSSSLFGHWRATSTGLRS